MQYLVKIASVDDFCHAENICLLMEESAKARKTGIAKREPEYLRRKMAEGKAIIALDDGKPIGFCYIENWEHKNYVSNSGLIVAPEYRKSGLAWIIKQKAFELSREMFPQAKLFGITTSQAVMKINTELGYKPATFTELTSDEVFWKGCKSCSNYDILQRTERKMCLCTAMIYDFSKTPSLPKTPKK